MARNQICVVGATGVVGREALRILAARGVLSDRIIAIASDRSAGDQIGYGESKILVRSLAQETFADVGVSLFCATADLAKDHAPRALAAGAWVIDNSSAFRLRPDVPLVIPEINSTALRENVGTRLIANPNCSTILLLMALHPLHQRFGVSSIDVATYQAVSGAGVAGIDELHSQIRSAIAGERAAPRIFPDLCAFNVFSHDSPVDHASGVNGEERKMIDESRKIWNAPMLRVTPTCVRVPVVRAHTQAITVTLRTSVSEDLIRAAYDAQPGVRIIDDRSINSFPTPLKASDGDEVLVGRIRADPGASSPLRSNRWCLLASMDQLRKGAALNAIQICDVVAPGLMIGRCTPTHAGSPRV